MKARFLFAPAPILIVAGLLGLDFWTHDHLGVLILVVFAAAGCVYESGKAYRSSSIRLPHVLFAVATGFWMLFAGSVLLYPDRFARFLEFLSGAGQAQGLLLATVMFPLLLIIFVVLVNGVRSGAEKTASGMLMGLGLVVLFGTVYLLVFPILSRFAPQPNLGTFWIVFVMVVSKGSDTGAYFIGKSFGRYKMTPRLSPNKTWAGLVGAVLSGMIIGGLFFWFSRIGTGQSMAMFLVLSACLSLGGAAGDLVGSLLKRGAKIDDSSDLFPGLGGILDMTDSFLGSVPVALLILFLIL